MLRQRLRVVLNWDCALPSDHVPLTETDDKDVDFVNLLTRTSNGSILLIGIADEDVVAQQKQ